MLVGFQIFYDIVYLVGISKVKDSFAFIFQTEP
jgi:hypothetical protein